MNDKEIRKIMEEGIKWDHEVGLTLLESRLKRPADTRIPMDMPGEEEEAHAHTIFNARLQAGA